MAEKEVENKVLFVSADAENRYGINTLLQKNEFEAYCRDSRKRSFQLLTITQMDLVVVGLELEDSAGLDFVREFRNDHNFQNTALVVVGEDGDNGVTCIEALEAGADDFVQCPFVAGVFLARINRYLRKKTKAGTISSLSVEGTSGELPGILSFLEAEIKTGKLTVKSGEKTAVIYLQEGRLSNGTAPHSEGLDAITEALSWPTSHVTFEECDLKDDEVKFSFETTKTIMNCVVEIDEFREAGKELPPGDVLLLPGAKSPTDDMNADMKRIHNLAVNGFSITELVSGQLFSERRATMFLKELIDEGFITVSDPPFHKFEKRCYKQYKKSRKFFETRLTEIKTILSELEFPLPALPQKLSLGTIDWVTPAPKIIVVGDRSEHIKMLKDSLSLVSTVKMQAKPPFRRLHKGSSVTRLYFGKRSLLDLQVLPPNFDESIIESLSEYLMDACGVILIASAQNRKATQNNLRIIRHLRQRFTGIYYMVVPQVQSQAGVYEFRMDCDNCGYSLSVDMELAGSMGECPICNEALTIPDSLDHLAHTLKLPDDVPIVQIQPDAENHCRDLLIFMIDSILTSCQTAEDSKTVVAENLTLQVLSTTEVRERIGKAKSGIHASLDESGTLDSDGGKPAAGPNPLPAPRLDTGNVPAHEKSSVTKSSADLIAQLDEILDSQSESDDGAPAAAASTEDAMADAIDEIIQSRGEIFDIDQFINKVRHLNRDEEKSG